MSYRRSYHETVNWKSHEPWTRNGRVKQNIYPSPFMNFLSFHLQVRQQFYRVTARFSDIFSGYSSPIEVILSDSESKYSFYIIVHCTLYLFVLRPCGKWSREVRTVKRKTQQGLSVQNVTSGLTKFVKPICGSGNSTCIHSLMLAHPL